jgi:hypothetical protein
MILWPICQWNCFQEFQALKRLGYDATVAADLGMDGASTHARCFSRGWEKILPASARRAT